jgi:hypothetical protein
VLASGTEKLEGYRYTYSAGPKRHGLIEAYTVHADPTTPGETHHYFVDQSGVIKIDFGKPANADSPPIAD